MGNIDLTTSADSPEKITSILDLIKREAQKTPHAAAIVAPGRPSLTYQGLLEHIEATVAALNGLGIGRNDRVAIVLPNGPEMAVSFLAVSACATSAPLNQAYRTNEYDFYLKDLNAKALLIPKDVESPARVVAKAQHIPIIELSFVFNKPAGTFKLEGDTISDSVNDGFAQVNDTALVLHTSGTTSRPKIVPLTQANLCISAGNIAESLALTGKDRCLNVMPLFHIHGLIGAVLSTLAVGGSVVCAPGFYGTEFFGWLSEFQPTWFTAVPTMHQAILSQAMSQADIIEKCSLRFIRSCSSPLPPSVFEDLENTFKVPTIESYGMTEASHQMASNPLPPGIRKIGSVGLPAGMDVGIMDEGGNFVLEGVIDEIVIRGANVTLGYENNPAANESSYTKGWFRTGDQGYMDADGYLFLTGRIKEIINRGGEKIAPREVDEALMTHPAVAQAVTFAVPHPTIGEDVVAAVILRENVTATEKEIREHTFSKIADFKVPSKLIVVDDIPKGPTGKLQRIGLAEKLAAKLETAFLAPRNEIEEALAGIWIEVLKTNQVGVFDNFFYLGGDSILAVKTVSRIRDAFGIEFPLGRIFREPTVAEQATVIGNILLDEIGTLSEEEAKDLNK
jgi:oxalate---CoA ligase